MRLELDAVHAGYGRTTVLHDVSLVVPDGEVVAVMGHNGAGKSTLLQVAVGLLQPTRGRVLLDGRDITGTPPHARIAQGMAYVPQGQQCFPQLTVGENLRLVADRAAAGTAGLADAMDLFPILGELTGRKAGLLSGGQRQQLALARALITRPRLLLLDEPTEGIQPSVVAELENIILDLAGRDGLSVLLVEQRVDFAAAASAAWHVLESGRVTLTGPGGQDASHRVRAALAV